MGVKAIVVAQLIVVTTSIRAKTCAIGRNMSMREPGGRTASPRRPTAFLAEPMKFACVSSAPLGRPVVPEV